ncbi:hypothetical protein [Pseudofrankia inefficax]|uniref:hypothetical protein n=1 Tax=Pseudofrankia inefficax (strain DSM 45817 / CECT 9037 / DDB 130130 / EuI1c) TaxID=298654 RepID=UPI0018E04977|nr:hypothetical protein [Pseudofrankia inefficax]
MLRPYPGAPEGDADAYIDPDHFHELFFADVDAEQAAFMASSRRGFAASGSRPVAPAPSPLDGGEDVALVDPAGGNPRVRFGDVISEIPCRYRDARLAKKADFGGRGVKVTAPIQPVGINLEPTVEPFARWAVQLLTPPRAEFRRTA